MDDTESPAMRTLRREIAGALVIDIRKRLDGNPDSVEFCRWLNLRTYEDACRLAKLALDEFEQGIPTCQTCGQDVETHADSGTCRPE